MGLPNPFGIQYGKQHHSAEERAFKRELKALGIDDPDQAHYLFTSHHPMRPFDKASFDERSERILTLAKSDPEMVNRAVRDLTAAINAPNSAAIRARVKADMDQEYARLKGGAPAATAADNTSAQPTATTPSEQPASAMATVGQGIADVVGTAPSAQPGAAVSTLSAQQAQPAAAAVNEQDSAVVQPEVEKPKLSADDLELVVRYWERRAEIANMTTESVRIQSYAETEKFRLENPDLFENMMSEGYDFSEAQQRRYGHAMDALGSHERAHPGREQREMSAGLELTRRNALNPAQENNDPRWLQTQEVAAPDMFNGVNFQEILLGFLDLFGLRDMLEPFIQKLAPGYDHSDVFTNTFSQLYNGVLADVDKAGYLGGTEQVKTLLAERVNELADNGTLVFDNDQERATFMDELERSVDLSYASPNGEFDRALFVNRMHEVAERLGVKRGAEPDAQVDADPADLVVEQAGPQPEGPPIEAPAADQPAAAEQPEMVPDVTALQMGPPAPEPEAEVTREAPAVPAADETEPQEPMEEVPAAALAVTPEFVGPLPLEERVAAQNTGPSPEELVAQQALAEALAAEEALVEDPIEPEPVVVEPNDPEVQAQFETGAPMAGAVHVDLSSLQYRAVSSFVVSEMAPQLSSMQLTLVELGNNTLSNSGELSLKEIAQAVGVDRILISELVDADGTIYAHCISDPDNPNGMNIHINSYDYADELQAYEDALNEPAENANALTTREDLALGAEPAEDPLSIEKPAEAVAATADVPQEEPVMEEHHEQPELFNLRESPMVVVTDTSFNISLQDLRSSIENKSAPLIDLTDGTLKLTRTLENVPMDPNTQLTASLVAFKDASGETPIRNAFIEFSAPDGTFFYMGLADLPVTMHRDIVNANLEPQSLNNDPAAQLRQQAVFDTSQLRSAAIDPNMTPGLSAA